MNAPQRFITISRCWHQHATAATHHDPSTTRQTQNAAWQERTGATVALNACVENVATSHEIFCAIAKFNFATTHGHWCKPPPHGRWCNWKPIAPTPMGGGLKNTFATLATLVTFCLYCYYYIRYILDPFANRKKNTYYIFDANSTISLKLFKSIFGNQFTPRGSILITNSTKSFLIFHSPYVVREDLSSSLNYYYN